MVGLFLAAAVVTFLQFLRVRRRQLVPLIVLFGALALAEGQEHWSVRRKWLQAGGVAAGLYLVAVLSSPREQSDRRRTP